MNAKMLLIEGTSGIGKSTLIAALWKKYFAEHRKIRSFLHLTQAHTYGPLAGAEDSQTLTSQQNCIHLQNIYKLLEWLASSVELEHKPKFFCLADTLHITHCVRPGVVTWGEVAGFDKSLSAIGCKLVFINAQPQTIWEMGIVPRKDEQFILEYAKKFGSTPVEIHKYFVGEQQRMKPLAEQSAMQKIFLYAESPLEANVEQAYNFWMSG